MSQASVPEKQKKKNDKSKSGTFKIGEFLQAPRKKRKQYIQMAVGANFDKDLAAAIQNYIKRQFPQHAVTLPTTVADFKRQSGRNVIFAIVDDEFAPRDEVLQSVQALKVRKQDQTVPVLFLTKKPDDLVDSYHEVLMAYQESDDFVDYTGCSTDQVLNRIKLGLETKGKRRSRRYKVDMNISCFHLSRNESIAASLIDMSVHGALIRANSGAIFRLGDQLRLSIPMAHHLPAEQGDFLKVSAKVRRVFISGDLVGVGFEYVSEHLALNLAQFVTSVVNSQLARSGTPTTTKKV